MKFNVPNESPVAFHNGSNYDLHFIMKKLSNKIKVKFECLRGSTGRWKYKFILIGKEIKKIEKDGIESVVTMS